MSEGRFFHGLKLLPVFSLVFACGYYLLVFVNGFWFDLFGLTLMMISFILFLYFFRLRLKKKRFITQNVRHVEPDLQLLKDGLDGDYLEMDILEFEAQNKRLPDLGVKTQMKVYGLELYENEMEKYPFLSTRLDEKTVTLVFKGMEIHLTDPQGVYVQKDRMILVHAPIVEIEVKKSSNKSVFGIDFIKVEENLRVVRYTKARDTIHFPGFNACALEMYGDFSCLMV